MKAILLKLYNFIQREFVAGSRQYFEQRFYSAFELITFDKSKIIQWDNNSEIQLSDLLKYYSFIDELILYRQKANGIEDYCELSYRIISNDFKRLKKDNIKYTDNPFESKQETFAYNVVKNHRNYFFSDIKQILFLIEKQYSVELNKDIPETLPLIKKQKQVLDHLRENEILDKNSKWQHNNNSHKKKYITVLIFKLMKLKLIVYKDYSIFHKKFENFIDCEFDYSNSTGMIKDFTKENMDEDSLLYFNNLSFLDPLAIK